jgi:diaminohydroxyphosphoribosylaminopyrimidine deaminase/5-amino-6-(5-phosphoribosylamino)uracil reductase
MTAPGQIAAAMALAVRQAQTVKGWSYPNPPVGAVILAADGDIAGVGATEPAGGAHAEVVALRAAGDRAAGGTAVVTLEPCNHHGRTPPCATIPLSMAPMACSRTPNQITDPA